MTPNCSTAQECDLPPSSGPPEDQTPWPKPSTFSGCGILGAAIGQGAVPSVATPRAQGAQVPPEVAEVAATPEVAKETPIPPEVAEATTEVAETTTEVAETTTEVAETTTEVAETTTEVAETTTEVAQEAPTPPEVAEVAAVESIPPEVAEVAAVESIPPEVAEIATTEAEEVPAPEVAEPAPAVPAGPVPGIDGAERVQWSCARCGNGLPWGSLWMQEAEDFYCS